MTNSISKTYATTLLQIRKEEGISDLFLSYIHELIHRNYKHSQIAQALQVSKTTVSKWAKRPHTPTSLQHLQLPEPQPEPYQLSAFEEQTLRDLATKAAKVSRNTAQSAPSRTAATTLENQLMHYIGLNVPISHLAKAANVSRRSIYQRLEKHQ